MKGLSHIKTIAFLFLLLAAVGAKGQDYEKILKSDSTSWITCHLELEFKTEGLAYVNNKDSLLYYNDYGSADYYCVGRLREENGKLWITYSEHPSEEVLLVDMDLEVGDEFPVTPYHVAHVVEINYEDSRKVIVFDFVSPFWGGEPLKFIEGVGRNFMVFEWYDNIDWNYQSCKFDGDEQVYSTANPLFEDCVFVSTSIDELTKEKDIIEVYPNPAQNEIRICFADSQETPMEICLLNLCGTVIKTIPATSGTAILHVDDLCSGVYGYTIRCGGNAKNGKIVIAK